jgi:hypothetical protein
LQRYLQHYNVARTSDRFDFFRLNELSRQSEPLGVTASARCEEEIVLHDEDSPRHRISLHKTLKYG